MFTEINKNLVLLFLILLLLNINSCDSNPAVIETDNNQIHDVATYTIKKEVIRQIFYGFGNLSFRKKTDITTAVDGTIKELYAEEGDFVDSNQPLATLSNIQLQIRKEQAQAALFSAESAFELAKTQYREGRLQIESRLIGIEKSELNLKQKRLELEHQRNLLENNNQLLMIGGTTEENTASIELALSALETEVLILEKDIQIKKIGFRDKDILSCGRSIPENSQEKLQTLLELNSMTLKSEQKVAEARLKSAAIELQSAEALLNETELFSPMKGIVGAKYMESGERIKADSKLFTIFDSSEVDLIFGVPEEIGVMLSPGKTVKLSLDAVKDREFSAVIRQISPTIDTHSGNITIKANLNNNENLFKPGMFSRFSIVYGPARNVMRVPAEAIVRLDGKRALVMKVVGGRVYPQSIIVEAEEEGMHELSEGLDEGDVVILTPSPLLKEGDPVNVK